MCPSSTPFVKSDLTGCVSVCLQEKGTIIDKLIKRCSKCPDVATAPYVMPDLLTCTDNCSQTNSRTWSDNLNLQCKYCNQTLANCKSCQSGTICKQCEVNMYLKSDATACISSCYSDTGSYIDAVNFKCIKCASNQYSKSDLSACIDNCILELNTYTDVKL